jgi:hypothetical protein
MESDKTKIEFGSAASAPRLDYDVSIANGEFSIDSLYLLRQWGGAKP